VDRLGLKTVGDLNGADCRHYRKLKISRSLCAGMQMVKKPTEAFQGGGCLFLEPFEVSASPSRKVLSKIENCVQTNFQRSP
jgi:hypothetical protein